MIFANYNLRQFQAMIKFNLKINNLLIGLKSEKGILIVTPTLRSGLLYP